MEIKIKGRKVKLVNLKDERNIVNTKINVYTPEFFFVDDNGEIIAPVVKDGYIYVNNEEGKAIRVFGLKVFEKDNEKILAMKPSIFFKVINRNGDPEEEIERFIYYNCYLIGNTFDYGNKTTRVKEVSSSLSTIIYETKEEKKIDYGEVLRGFEELFGK